jgi:rod shape-determining protein MreC
MGMGFWDRNKNTVVILVTIFVLTGLVSFSSRDRVAQTLLEKWIQRTVAPVQRATAFIVYQGRQLGRSITEIGSLRRENERLLAELEGLRFQFNNLLESSLEVERLRLLLDYREGNQDLDLIMGRIIARGAATWQHEIILDRGSNHGVSLSDPVVTHTGAVGRVVEVSPTTSKILLITDPRSGVATVIQDSRDGAIVEGDPMAAGMLRIPRLPRDVAVDIGDAVVTSGLGGIFPRDHSFMIGTVASVTVSSDGLLQTISIRPAVDFSRLEEVLIVRMWR